MLYQLSYYRKRFRSTKVTIFCFLLALRAKLFFYREACSGSVRLFPLYTPSRDTLLSYARDSVETKRLHMTNCTAPRIKR